LTEKMNILFVHNNFPAQYRFLIRALTREEGHNLVAVGSPTARAVKGVKLLTYAMDGADVSATHPFARRFDLECRRAEQVLYSLTSMVASGFVPDVILAHPGWGEALPLRSFFPRARILVYCEFFYGAAGRDLGFDAEFPESGLDGHVALHLKNAATLLALSDCDRGTSPTKWQRSTFPRRFQHEIDVVHDGVDTDMAKPDPEARFRMPSGQTLTAADEVVTFVARNLEPLRGYHVFMRALPRILEERPHAQVVIVGADGTSYGMPPPPGTTWKSKYFQEVAGRIDTSRVHFVGRLPYNAYLTVLQISSAHVYLTYPFVLSWSLLEALSTGCAVIASDTAPVREAIDGENGSLVPFFDVTTLAERVIEVLARPHQTRSMREKARQSVIDTYDAERICVPKVMALIHRTDDAVPRETPPVPTPAGGQSNDASDLFVATEKAI
jgi:glycosyltransferase involved in cell wall biosynthesis